MPEPVPGRETPGAGQGSGDALWDDWGTPLRAPATPLLHLDGYEGPIDLLLDLAGRQRIDLGRLSILVLIEQFLAELDGRLRQAALERRADWVVVAARLVLLRSRLMAPASPEVTAAAQRDADAELHRLEAGVQVSAAAAWLQARPQLGHDVFARPSRGPDPRTASYMALMQACLVVLRQSVAQAQDTPVYWPRPPELWSVAQAIARIRAMLETAPRGGELGSFLPAIADNEPQRPLKARAAVASTLVAGLELARRGELVLRQEEAFSTIELVSRADRTPRRTRQGASKASLCSAVASPRSARRQSAHTEHRFRFRAPSSGFRVPEKTLADCGPVWRVKTITTP